MMLLTKEQIQHMVDRFLGWRLPENFSPDAGISFKKTFNEHTAHPMKHEPSGTNLFDATQADAMVRYMVDGIPLSAADRTGFHWRDGWYFDRLTNGSVQVTKYADAGASDRVEVMFTIPPTEWASVVASVSAGGETLETYRDALRAHMEKQ